MLASLLLFVSNIWGSLSHTYDILLGSRILAAFAGSSTEALGAAIVNVSAVLTQILLC